MSNLSELTVKELQTMAKERGITTYKGKTAKNKPTLIAEITEYDNRNSVNSVSETKQVFSGSGKINIPEEIVNNLPQDIPETRNVLKENNFPISEVEDDFPDPETFCKTKNKEQYIENAEVGTLVAFLDDKGKPRTAAIVNRSSKRRVLKVQTEFGWEFIVPYDRVMWVKNGVWPRGVYRILKEWKYRNGNKNTK